MQSTRAIMKKIYLLKCLLRHLNALSCKFNVAKRYEQNMNKL